VPVSVRNLDDLLAAAPRFHVDADGAPTSHQLATEALRHIDRLVGEGARTLETGEGVSTALFALKRARHTTVSPHARALELVRLFCQEHGIGTSTVTFAQDVSQRALPRLDLADLDLVLVDGGHGFPTPFIDWYYAAGALRLGGVLMVDDIDLWTCRVLVEFLREEPAWRYERTLGGRTAVFTRVGLGEHAAEWIHQPYVVRNSGSPRRRSLPGRVARRVARGIAPR
jgi:predicted O-methyltransferase YrrM